MKFVCGIIVPTKYSLSRVVEGRGPMKPGSLFIQGANSRGFPKDEVIANCDDKPLLWKRFLYATLSNLYD